MLSQFIPEQTGLRGPLCGSTIVDHVTAEYVAVYPGFSWVHKGVEVLVECNEAFLARAALCAASFFILWWFAQPFSRMKVSLQPWTLQENGRSGEFRTKSLVNQTSEYLSPSE